MHNVRPIDSGLPQTVLVHTYARVLYASRIQLKKPKCNHVKSFTQLQQKLKYLLPTPHRPNLPSRASVKQSKSTAASPGVTKGTQNYMFIAIADT